MAEISDAKRTCQQIAALPVYQELVAARRTHDVKKGQDNSEKLTRLFLAVNEFIKTALTAAWGEIGFKHFGQENAETNAICELSQYEEELLAAAKEHLPVWLEIKGFLDKKGLSFGQRMREGRQMQIH